MTSAPSNPWLSGVSSLFTREFFEIGRRKLRPDGVWAQWIQAYGMSPEDLKSLFATFADTYPHVRLFRVNASDLILVGSGVPLPIDTAAQGGIFHRSAALTDDLARIEILRSEHILGLYCCSRDTLKAMAGEIERNTDDNMRIEYSAPLHLHEPTEENSRLLASVAELPLEAVKGTESLISLARAYARWDPSWRRALATLRAAHAQDPDNPEVRQLHTAYLAQARALVGRNE